MTVLAATLIFIAHPAVTDVAGFSSTAEAETDDYLKDVPPSDVSEWNYYGIDAEESKKWIQEGIIFAGWAAQWRSEGFSAEAAGRWRKIANVYTAGDFLKNGFGPDEAKAWMDNGIRSGLRAREYLTAGLTATEAGSFWKAGFFPQEVKEWRDAGFDAEAMLQWRYGPRESAFFYTKDSPSGRTVYKLDMAVKWRSAGFAPLEAHLSGVYGILLTEATRWKEAGFSFDDTVNWKDSGFTLDEAVVNRDSGLSHVEAELKRYDESDNKGDEITSYDTDITVHMNGALDVIETIAMIDRPGGAYQNGYYRVLPRNEQLRSLRSFGFGKTTYSQPGFQVTSVDVDGVPGDYYLSDGVLHFGSKHAPLQEGTHLIKISYTTDSRILDEPHHDELYFGMVEDNHAGRYIRKSSATIRLPKGAEVIFTDGKAGLYQRKDFVSSVEETDSGDIAHFTLARPLKEGMDFAVNVAFIKGHVNEGSLHRIAQLDKRTGRFLSSLGVFVLGFTVSFFYYVIAWFKVGRDPKNRGPAVAEFSAPDNVDPARMRALRAKARTDSLSVAAELLYLAERGLATISEREGTYKIDRMQADSAHLTPVAKAFSEAFFGEKSSVFLTRRGKSKEASHAVHALRTLLKTEYAKHGASNRRFLWPGMIISLVSIGAALAVIDHQELDGGIAGAAFAFYAVFLSSVFSALSFTFMRLLRTRTREYVLLLERIGNYDDFLARSFADRGAARFLPPFLQEHLPYAVAAGIDVHDIIIRNGEAKWYHGTSGGFGCADFLNTVKKIV